MARLSLALALLALLVSAPAAMAATTVRTGDNVIEGSYYGGPPGSIALQGWVDSIDWSQCTAPQNQVLGIGFDYALDDSFAASGGAYDQFATNPTNGVTSPQGVTMLVGDGPEPALTIGATYHFRIVAWCAEGYGTTPGGYGAGPIIAVGADRTFVCCDSGATGTGGGGGGGGTDTQDPTIEIRSPANGAQYLIGSGPAADYECKDAGVLLGPSQCVGTVPDGYGVPTSNAGTYEFKVTATDNAGNTSELTHTYTVTYAGSGKAKDYNPKIADEGWFPKQCDPTKGTFDIQKCLVEGWEKLSKGAKDWWASPWPAKQGTGMAFSTPAGRRSASRWRTET